MKIYSVFEEKFRPYGRVKKGYDVEPIVQALRANTPLPERTDYVPEESVLQNLPAAKALAPALYGGQPVQFGWCNGHNTKLNCLEYHRDSEFNLGTEDFILLLARQQDVSEQQTLDTETVRAFRVPAGVVVEIYATTLHYAPCHTDAKKGFRVMVALPQGTNMQKPAMQTSGGDDTLLWACNKWLLAHPDSAEAAEGAWIGLTGENIELAAEK
jgi:hypothetical protein